MEQEIEDERDIEVIQCPNCGGTGEHWNPLHGLFDDQCSRCEGFGYFERRPIEARPDTTSKEGRDGGD